MSNPYSGQLQSAGERYWQAQVWQPVPSSPEEWLRVHLLAARIQKMLAQAEQITGLSWSHMPSAEPDYDAILLASRKRREREAPFEGTAWSDEDVKTMQAIRHAERQSVSLSRALSQSPNDKPLMQQARLGAR